MVEFQKLVDAKRVMALETDNGTKLVLGEIAFECEKERLKGRVKFDLDKSAAGRKARVATPSDFHQIMVFRIEPLDDPAHECICGGVEPGIERLVVGSKDVLKFLDRDAVQLEVFIGLVDQSEHVKNDPLLVDGKSGPLGLVQQIVGDGDEIFGFGLINELVVQ